MKNLKSIIFLTAIGLETSAHAVPMTPDAAPMIPEDPSSAAAKSGISRQKVEDPWKNAENIARYISPGPTSISIIDHVTINEWSVPDRSPRTRYTFDSNSPPPLPPLLRATAPVATSAPPSTAPVSSPAPVGSSKAANPSSGGASKDLKKDPE